MASGTPWPHRNGAGLFDDDQSGASQQKGLPMKPMSSVFRCLFLPTFFILAPAGCKISHAASPPSPAAPNPTAPTAPQRPGSAVASPVSTKGGDYSNVPFVPKVLDRDPLAESLRKSLRRAGLARHGEQQPAEKALKEAFDAKGLRIATPLDEIQCFGTEATDDVKKHNLDLQQRIDKANDRRGRRPLRDSIRRAGCIEDVRYARAEDVVAFDRQVLGARPVAPPFSTWVGSSGHTAPRWQRDAHGKRTIVATWYFLRPEAAGYDASDNNTPNYKDAK